MKITKGQTLMFSSGAYSDYYVGSIMRALRDFDTEEMLKEFNGVPERPGHESLTTWLMREGFADDVEYTELHEEADYLGQQGGQPRYRVKLDCDR